MSPPRDTVWCIRIPKQEALALEAKCARDGVRVAQFLRDCLLAYLADRLPHADRSMRPAQTAGRDASRVLCTRLLPGERQALEAKAVNMPAAPQLLIRACVTAYLHDQLSLIPPSVAVLPSYFWRTSPLPRPLPAETPMIPGPYALCELLPGAAGDAATYRTIRAGYETAAQAYADRPARAAAAGIAAVDCYVIRLIDVMEAEYFVR